jgi:hypothetical protein
LKILKNLLFYAKNYWIKIYRLFLFFSVKSIQNEDESVIVSLTTHPARIKSSWIAIISLFNQMAVNYKIILVLSKEEFQNKKIPWTINFLEKKGLNILWINKNFKSYNKLLPVKSKFPNSKIITFDDDVYYEKWRIKLLLEKSKTFPNAIIGFRGAEIKTTKDKKIYPYLKWVMANARTSNKKLFLTGVGGVLYPPNKNFDLLIQNYSLARELAPTCDDVFFWGVSHHLNIQKILLDYGKLDDVRELLNSPSLFHVNNSLKFNNNDYSIKKVIDFFKILI